MSYQDRYVKNGIGFDPTANGHLRDMVCRGLLLELERNGYIVLPPRKFTPINPFLKPKAPKKIELDQSPIKTVLKEKRGHARKLRDIPSEVLLSSKDGMKNDCAINLDHIQTVSKGKIGALITELSSTKLNQLRQALNFALGFSEEIEKS